ncbi:glycosyltransferase [Pelagibacteraceae bacterium]|nr:glycosyltransferase [Pelagibacteraceae bacterium]
MKILHISNFVQKHDGRLFWNSAFKFSNGFTRLGHNVLNFSERDIARNNIFGSNKFGIKKLNKRIINTVKNYNPDLIVMGHADLVDNDTLKHIKKNYPNIKIILWNVDHPLMNNTLSKIKKRSKYVSNTFITNADNILKSAAINDMEISFIPNLFDKSIDDLKVFQKRAYQHDIFFAMSHGVGSGKLKKNKYDGREIILRKISSNKEINTNFFGIDGIEPVWGQKFIEELSKSPMGINLNQGKYAYLYSSDRISTYIGNGLCTFIKSDQGFEEIYNENEVVYFTDADHLIDKIKFFKNDPDLIRSIAHEGWLKSHTYFNATVICKYILDKTFSTLDSNINWPDISYN